MNVTGGCAVAFLNIPPIRRRNSQNSFVVKFVIKLSLKTCYRPYRAHLFGFSIILLEPPVPPELQDQLRVAVDDGAGREGVGGEDLRLRFLILLKMLSLGGLWARLNIVSEKALDRDKVLDITLKQHDASLQNIIALSRDIIA